MFKVFFLTGVQSQEELNRHNQDISRADSKDDKSRLWDALRARYRHPVLQGDPTGLANYGTPASSTQPCKDLQTPKTP